MKTLFCALGKQDDIMEALKSQGSVIYFDWTKHQQWFNNSIKYLVEEHKPDMVFMQLQTPDIISVETAKHIASKTKVVNWTGDVRAPLPQWYINIGKEIHLTLFTNMVDVNTCRRQGVKSNYLQIGFPDKIFTPKGTVKPAPEIVFFGNNNGGFPLSKMRLAMITLLKKRYGSRFGYYGNWGGGVKSITSQVEEAAMYRGAKVAINLSHFNYSRYSSDRLFRALGAGCFVLGHDYKDMELEFTDGKHLAAWKTFEELTSQIDYFLNKVLLRQGIAKQGCELVHAEHTWKNRIEQLINML